MRKAVAALAVVVLVAACLPASASVVALKRDAGLTDARGFDASLASAITGGSVSVYSGPGVIADAGSLYCDQGWAQQEIYKNSGAASTANSWQAVLVKLGLNAVPGFAGSTVAKAELRFYTAAGNGGMNNTGYVTSSDWIEGTATGGFPGAAGGVSGAHPQGHNTDAYQQADGTPVNVGYPPDMSKAPFSWAGNQPFAPAKDGVTVVSGVAHNPWGVTAGQWDQYLTIDVTSILQAWAGGTANYGLFIDNTGNYSPLLSENTTNVDWQPVLMMDYSPTPEPMTLALLALSGMALVRRRRIG